MAISIYCQYQWNYCHRPCTRNLGEVDLAILRVEFLGIFFLGESICGEDIVFGMVAYPDIWPLCFVRRYFDPSDLSKRGNHRGSYMSIASPYKMRPQNDYNHYGWRGDNYV